MLLVADVYDGNTVWSSSLFTIRILEVSDNSGQLLFLKHGRSKNEQRFTRCFPENLPIECFGYPAD